MLYLCKATVPSFYTQSYDKFPGPIFSPIVLRVRVPSPVIRDPSSVFRLPPSVFRYFYAEHASTPHDTDFSMRSPPNLSSSKRLVVGQNFNQSARCQVIAEMKSWRWIQGVSVTRRPPVDAISFIAMKSSRVFVLALHAFLPYSSTLSRIPVTYRPIHSLASVIKCDRHERPGSQKSQNLLRKHDISHNGFLPPKLPLSRLPDPLYESWEEIVAHLPQLLERKELHRSVDRLEILPTHGLRTEDEWRRAYVVLSFLAHAYIWGGAKASEVSIRPLTTNYGKQLTKHNRF